MLEDSNDTDEDIDGGEEVSESDAETSTTDNNDKETGNYDDNEEEQQYECNDTTNIYTA